MCEATAREVVEACKGLGELFQVGEPAMVYPLAKEPFSRAVASFDPMLTECSALLPIFLDLVGLPTYADAEFCSTVP